jgi:hypothetical protein
MDGPCVRFNAVSAIPGSIKKAFTAATHGAEFAMADPTDEYQATDVIVQPDLPIRRLLFVGHCGNRWIVHYERGGFAHSYDAMIFTDALSPGFVWGGTTSSPSSNLEELRQNITLGRFNDDPRNYL